MNGKSELLPGHYYCTKDVSDIFGVNESTIKRWTDSGKLKCFRTLGGHRRYSVDWIMEFIDASNCTVTWTPNEETVNPGDPMIDSLLSEDDYRTLREVYFADALKGDIDDQSRILIQCCSKGKIPQEMIFDEIVLKTIDRIRNLGRRQKLSREQEQAAINAVLESLDRSKRFFQTHTQVQV